MLEMLSSRRAARTAINDALRDCAAGRASSDALDVAAAMLEALPQYQADRVLVALTSAVRALAFAARWEPATLAADPRPERFRDAAKAHAELIWTSIQDGPAPLVSAVALLTQLSEPRQARKIAEMLLQVPLSVHVTEGHPRSSSAPAMRPKPEIPTVLVLLTLDGQPVPAQAIVAVGRLYDLGVTVKTGRWPKGAETLRVDFLTHLGPSDITIDGVDIRPQEANKTRPFALKVARQAPARPLDVVVLAKFVMADGQRHPARVVGYPSLWVSTFDPATALPRSMPTTSKRLVEMLAEFDAKLPSAPSPMRDDWYTMMESLMRYASIVSQKGLLLVQERRQSRIAESRFQRDVATFLAADPNIGMRLGRDALGGGLTDLRLGDVVLELKVENDQPVSAESCSGYLGQPAQYAGGADSQVSILCVLDNSPKDAPPGVLANDAAWMYPRLHGMTDPRYPSMVAVLVIPVGFPPPSTWSRRGRHKQG